MLKKDLTVGIILLFVFSSVIPIAISNNQISGDYIIYTDDCSVDSIILRETIRNITMKENLEKKFWAVIVGSNPFNDSCGSGFICKAQYLKNILSSFCCMNYHLTTLLDQNATKSNLINAIDWIAQNDKPSDITLIYLNDHGGRGYFCLSGGNMQYDELNKELDKLDSSAIGIIINACHSGSAISYLQQEGRVVVTSCRENETCGDFSSYLFTGLVGFADKKDGIGNNNGVVSLEETFNFCINEYDWVWMDEQPQIQDNYTGQLNLTFPDGGYDQIDQFHNRTMKYDTVGSIFRGYQSAQSFKPSFEVLTKVQLVINRDKNSNPRHPLMISIRKNLTGEDLTSIEVQAYRVKKCIGYQLIDFQDINVNPGSTYYIVCRTAPDENDGYFWAGGDENCYDNGEYFQSLDNGETWHYGDLDEEQDLFFVTYGAYNINSVPDKPKINGPVFGVTGIGYKYKFNSLDVDGDDIYYCIDWNDNTGEVCIGPYSSNEEIKVNHIWNENGKYSIKVKAKDEFGGESDWATLEVTMPKNKIINTSFLQFLENHPHMFPILRQLLRL